MTTPTPTTALTSTADRAQALEERMTRDRDQVFDAVRAVARDLAHAADAGDLEALAHAAYLAIGDLAVDFTALGTCLALLRWRPSDRKRIDAIRRLGEGLRRDRPYPYDPTAVVETAQASADLPSFWSTPVEAWTWHEREHFRLWLVGALERPEMVARLEALPPQRTAEAPALHRWLIDSARWLQDPRPVEEKGHVPDLPDEEPAAPPSA